MGQVAYSIAEAAATTATSEATIAEEIRAGRLVSRTAGTTRIVLHSDLIEWAEALPIVSRSPGVAAIVHLSVAT